MAQEFAKEFYNSKAWRECRSAFLHERLFICERCKGLGNIAHHKTEITKTNINDPEITLSWGNLECVCQDCHNEIHNAQKEKSVRAGLGFDETGQLIRTSNIPP